MDADTLGYSRSKWVAEAICSRLASQMPGQGRLKIVRIGQLTADTKHGIWNRNEAYPLMLSTINELHCLPRIFDKLSWLPLDVAGRAVCEIGLEECEKDKSDATKQCEVYPVVSNETEICFMHLVDWLMGWKDKRFEVVEPKEWLSMLEQLEDHPAKALIELWRRAYDSGDEKIAQEVLFETANERKESKALREVQHVDERLFEQIGKWLEGWYSW